MAGEGDALRVGSGETILPVGTPEDHVRGGLALDADGPGSRIASVINKIVGEGCALRGIGLTGGPKEMLGIGLGMQRRGEGDDQEQKQSASARGLNEDPLFPESISAVKRGRVGMRKRSHERCSFIYLSVFLSLFANPTREAAQ